MNLTRGFIAELVGTFVLVFIGALAVVLTGAPYEAGNVVIPAFAHGLILIALIYAYGHFSGAQFNPAVTLGLLVGGKQDVQKSVSFMVAQFLGGIIAGLAVAAILPDPGNYGATIGSLTADNVGNAAILEAILTFLLVSTIYQTAVFGKAGNLAGVAIGLTLAACIFAGGPLTGASLNPARTLGPAIAAGDLSYVVPYLIGIFIGGAAGGIFHTYVLPADEE